MGFWSLVGMYGLDILGCIYYEEMKKLTRRIEWYYWGLTTLVVSTSSESFGIELKSLILAQIERWRHALHMQVGRQHGLRPDGEWRTGE